MTCRRRIRPTCPPSSPLASTTIATPLEPWRTRITTSSTSPCPGVDSHDSGLTDLDVRVLAIDPVNRKTLYVGGTHCAFKSIDRRRFGT